MKNKISQLTVKLYSEGIPENFTIYSLSIITQVLLKTKANRFGSKI